MEQLLLRLRNTPEASSLLSRFTAELIIVIWGERRASHCRAGHAEAGASHLHVCVSPDAAGRRVSLLLGELPLANQSIEGSVGGSHAAL